jgi:hypothetical protein
MNEKKVKCMKDYTCDQCGQVIEKGAYSKYGTDRQPRYDCGDNQVGIDYTKWRLHLNPETCNKNNL